MAIFFVDSFFASDLFTFKKSCDSKCCVPDSIDIFEIDIIFFFKCKISKQKKLSHQYLFYLDQPLKLCLRDGTITRKKTKCTVKVANNTCLK